MMVAPAKPCEYLKKRPSGLTTISAVSLMSSTTRPKVQSSARTTTMLRRVRAAALGVREHLVEEHEREQPTAQAVHRDALDPFDALVGVCAVEAHQLEQAALRDGVASPRRR